MLKTRLSYKDKGGLRKLRARDPVGPQKVQEPGVGRWRDSLSFSSLPFSLYQSLFLLFLCFLSFCLQLTEQMEKTHSQLYSYSSAPKLQARPSPLICSHSARSHFVRWLLDRFPLRRGTQLEIARQPLHRAHHTPLQLFPPTVPDPGHALALARSIFKISILGSPAEMPTLYIWRGTQKSVRCKSPSDVAGTLLWNLLWYPGYSHPPEFFIFGFPCLLAWLSSPAFCYFSTNQNISHFSRSRLSAIFSSGVFSWFCRWRSISYSFVLSPCFTVIH